MVVGEGPLAGERLVGLGLFGELLEHPRLGGDLGGELGRRGGEVELLEADRGRTPGPAGAVDVAGGERVGGLALGALRLLEAELGRHLGVAGPPGRLIAGDDVDVDRDAMSSAGPTYGSAAKFLEWAGLDSNQGPTDYESGGWLNPLPPNSRA